MIAVQAGLPCCQDLGSPRAHTGASPLRSDSRQSAVLGHEATAHDVALAAEGDVSAFERVYHAHLPRVHSLVRRMTGGRDADEITQDVFVRVWQKLRRFRGDSAFATWLHRLAVNVVIERFRAETARRSRLARRRAPPRHAPGARRSRAICRWISRPRSTKLPDGAREIFVLHDVEGYKHHEIAHAARRFRPARRRRSCTARE